MSVQHDHKFFFFNDTATTEIYTLSLHDALPIWPWPAMSARSRRTATAAMSTAAPSRSEEHTSELQSRPHLVCRLLLEKKKRQMKATIAIFGMVNTEAGHAVTRGPSDNQNESMPA